MNAILVYGLTPRAWERLPYLEKVARIYLLRGADPADIAALMPVWERVISGEGF